MLNNKVIFTANSSVRIDDLNYGNHLCHSKMISHIHQARALFLKSHELSELNCYGYGLIMLGLNIQYLSQCHFDDALEIQIVIPELDEVRFKLLYKVENLKTQKVAAKAETVMGFYDFTKNKLARMPEDFLKLLDSI